MAFKESIGFFQLGQAENEMWRNRDSLLRRKPADGRLFGGQVSSRFSRDFYCGGEFQCFSCGLQVTS